MTAHPDKTICRYCGEAIIPGTALHQCWPSPPMTWTTETLHEDPKARRERIATAALQGIIAACANPACNATTEPREAARRACEYADALIAALDKEEE